MKIAIIGGGGKISSAVIYKFLSDVHDVSLTFALFGRNKEKIEDTLTLSKRFNSGNGEILYCKTLDEALEGSQIVFYCATHGTDDFADLRSMGITNGAHILHIGKRVSEICPNAWLLVATNPPCVPLMALRMRYGFKKSIALCNAGMFGKRMISSFLNCDEARLTMHEFGINHEFWYYDILLDGKDIYDELRERLPAEYDRGNMKGEFHEEFPEWSYGFKNTVEILRLTGFLSAPVGGSKRYANLPVTDMWSIASRPTADDFKRMLDGEQTNEQILKTAMRCGGGIPLYSADLLKSLIYSDGREHSVIAFNDGAADMYPDDSMFQMSCRITNDKVVTPELTKVDSYIHAVLASRIRQNHLMAEALAYQDDLKLRQALSVYPERIDICKTDNFLQNHSSVEPFIQLN